MHKFYRPVFCQLPSVRLAHKDKSFVRRIILLLSVLVLKLKVRPETPAAVATEQVVLCSTLFPSQMQNGHL